MRTFYGNGGLNDKWTLNLTWAKAKKIADICERPDSTKENRKTYNLFNMTDMEQAACFSLYDPQTGDFKLNHAEHLVNVFYVLCEEQCKEREMTDVQFGEMMASSVFGDAHRALM
jgi:hypothetical protein